MGNLILNRCSAPWQDYLRWRSDFHDVLEPEFYTPDWLDGEVACGRMHLFCSEQSAILVSIKTYPTGLKEVHGEVAAGKLGDIVANLIPLIEIWARARGCSVATIQSREGWVRAMKRSGYNLHQSIIRKAL